MRNILKKTDIATAINQALTEKTKMPKYTLPSGRASIDYEHEFGEIDLTYPGSSKDSIIECLKESLLENARFEKTLYDINERLNGIAL